MLIAITLGNYLGYLPMEDYIIANALAQADNESENQEPEEPPEEPAPPPNPVDNENRNQLGLIAILAEKGIMSDPEIRNRVMAYAKDAQGRIPHSKAFVMEVPSDESTFRLASALEKMYYEGIDTDLIDVNPLNDNRATEDDNRLAGVVLIGNVPIPVVHEEGGQTGPSLYPYTDFYRKRYIYNHDSDRFEVNSEVSAPSPEVWHGVIIPSSHDPAEAKQELISYFDKNHNFTNEADGMADFEKRMLYANFPALEAQMNVMDYNNYKRYDKYMEELAFNRYTNDLLKEIIREFSDETGSDEPIMADELVEGMIFTTVEFNIKKYVTNFAESLRVYLSGINGEIEKTGRWTSSDVDSPEELITFRDEYAKNQIKRKQLMLESEIDDLINQQISANDRAENVVTLARFNVQLEVEGLEVDDKTFTFFSYFDGQRVQDISSVDQCGIQVGQEREDNETVLENNSVLVDANRMYNPETLIEPPDDDDDWELEETNRYKRYGGCVYNNSITVESQNLDPSNCIREHAEDPLFDIIGSIRVEEGAPVYEDANRCSVDHMIFKLTDEEQFESIAAGYDIIGFGAELIDVINRAYNDLGGILPDPSRVQRGSFVVRELAASGQEYSYDPLPLTTITVSVSTETKPIDSVYPHVEPTNDTLMAIKHIGEPRVNPNGEINIPQIVTRNIPSDGIRYLAFARQGIDLAFDYLNLFRIDGENPGQILGNLLNQIQAKQDELDSKTNSQTNVLQEFFISNSEIIEPIIWRSSSIDQKLAEIIPKYLDQNSFMPTPFYNPRRSPINRPNGYEVLHIVADGDAHGYQFGLNRAMLEQARGSSDEGIFGGTGTGGPDLEEGEEGAGGGSESEGNYICGDPAGVEIWEWFDALQCWMQEEIIPAHELFALSQACTAAPLPPEEEEEEEGDLFDELLGTPASFKVEMKRQSLVPGQEEAITVSAYNSLGEPLLGFIDMPIHFELEDPDLGSFSNNDVYIFTGEREITFTAEEIGSTTMTVTMGDFDPETIDIDIFESISLQIQGAEEIKNGRSSFTIAGRLRDPNGNNIINVNAPILLAPEQPADGNFERGGNMNLENGQGDIGFTPAPGKQSIKLVSKDPYIFGERTIFPRGGGATQILLRAPPYIPIGETVEVQVIAADEFGFPDDDFDETITVSISDQTSDLASVVESQVTMSEGQGTAVIQGGKETGDIGVIAEHDELRSATLAIPLLARVDSEEWKATYPQNLFASFVGFPAGDFTQENYFGGTHLFGGKTQAVYSFLSAPAPEPTLLISPNHLITITDLNQQVFTEFFGNEMLLQVFDQKTVRTLISKKVALDFDAVELYEGQQPETGKMYLEMLDDNYLSTGTANGFQVKDLGNNVVLDLRTNGISIIDNTFQLTYNDQPEFPMVELLLQNELGTIGRLILGLKPETISPDDFEEINPNLNSITIFGGKSTSDPTGLLFHLHDAEVPEVERDEFYGISGQQRYLSLFASGTNVGDAIKYRMPANAVLLGDPTIHLETRSTSSLNFNSATGQQIFEDPLESQIASINHFDFNNDGEEDIALLLEDGRVKLLEAGPTEPPYTDRGNIANLADGGVALETFDFKNDGYEDLVVATEEGRLAILQNDREIITRTDHRLNVGKKIYKLFANDMDQDGYTDLVVHDSRGDILIFYFDPDTGFPETGTLVANYGFSLNPNANLNADIDVRYDGIPEPPEPGDALIPSNRPSLEEFEGGGEIDDDAALAFVQGLYDAQEEQANNPDAAFEEEVPKLPWPEGDETETYFAPIETINQLDVTKTVQNKERPEAINVDIDETLTYTIELNSSSNLNNVVLADTVIDALTFMPDSVTCVQGGCQNIEATQNSIIVFLSGLNLSAGQPTILTYDVTVAHTPESALIIHRIDEPNQNLPVPGSIIDPYLDILVSPPYNNTGRLLYHYTTSPRTYERVQDNPPPAPEEAEPIPGDCQAQLEALKNGNFDEDNPPPELDLSCMGDSIGSALDKATGNNDCFEDPDSSVTCAEGVLDDIAGAINNFACMGGGCFPMPFNRAFLVPPDFPLPVFAFPTTLPTPVGPMPFVWPGSIIGAASILGPINSLMRFYVSPTLTGGIGLAMCWGPYPVSPVVPPPVFPIPYPPPIGNCMVTALPVYDLYGGEDGLCALAERGMNELMDLITSGVNKVQSGIQSAVSTIPGGNVQAGGPQQGASGGLEISLGINLGNSMKFDPPAKAFSNIHIPTFDSIGGVISSWVDRQTLEIQNKLLTLPTFSIYLPDIKSLFTLDFSRTIKRFEQWKNTMSGSASATANSLKRIGNRQSSDAPNPNEGEDAVLEGLGWVRNNTQSIKGSKALQYAGAVETQARIYNLNALEGLYDVASSLPLVKLTEKPIQFDIPWLSTAEIQSFIMELQQWVIYYEGEYDRVKDKWEELTCAGQIETTESPGARTDECIGRHLAESFGVSFDDLINSAKENIEVLESYLNFPRQLVKFKQQLADYIRSVACYLDVIAQMMAGWYATLQQQMVSWAELILTIIEIVKNIKELFDLFVNFDTNCDICTNERFSNFGWWTLLGLILPDIPIIQFPKWPDIVLDLSNIDIALDIELPILNIRPKPIPLPPLPYIRLPDFPNISIFLSLPPLPILPRLPELPDLPPLPPLPTVQLPTLPAPPKLPDVGQAFELIIPLIEKVLQIWCMMKKALAPVPEMMLNDQITQLTNRPAYLIPLDILKVQLPNIAPFDLGFNQIRIETVVYLGLRINVVSKPLEDLADTWNGWIQEIPDAMNRVYQQYIIETEQFLQERIDEAEQAMEDAARSFEEAFDEYVQGWIDKNVGDPLEEADKWLRDREATWQEWADEQGIDWTYEQYYTSINNAYEKVRLAKDEKIDQFFEENRKFIHGMNALIPLAPLLEFANEERLGDDLQWALDKIAEKLNQFGSLGPTVLQRLYSCIRYVGDCKENEQRYFGDLEAKAGPEAPSAPVEVAEKPITIAAQYGYSSKDRMAKELLRTPQGEEMLGLFAQMADVINEVNNAELVDYTVLKKRFNVPDYEPPIRSESIDKLRQMEKALIEQSEQLMAEAIGQKHITDLNALAGVPPQNRLPYQLTSTEVDENDQEVRVFTNALPLPAEPDDKVQDVFAKQRVELQKTADRVFKQNEPIPSPDQTSGPCRAAVCLPDPVTSDPVPVIPFIDFLATSETLFMPNGHVAYSDGTGLYLKRDLTLDDSDRNTDTTNPKRFVFDSNFRAMMRMEDAPKEAINMMQSTFTENGAATFTWLPTSNESIYGYGMELERTITGYDRNRQSNQTADTKLILLPANEDGSQPEVLADGQPISFGTLATSLTDAEEAAARFGVEPRNVVTGISEVRFPTIGRAFIRLDDYQAVYFDQLEGSAYSMQMENGFYHIKMTWFDENARTATYNRNELLAPQIYAGTADPIDVAQVDTYYMPIYKEKEIRASELFVDLAGAYDYYWYIDPDNNPLSPIVGETLVIPPQEEVRSFNVKLVASQDITDDSFETFEKTFQVKVYVPNMKLDEGPLAEGIISGSMTPIQQDVGADLSDIPFSVFRKRMNTWKNIGLLRDQNPDKDPTDPPLNDHAGRTYEYPDSYYSEDGAGTYYIEGFEIIDPSPIIFKDQDGNIVAEVQPGTGQINLLDPNFDLKAVPASTNTPTHIAIIKKDTEEILGNVYFVASSAPDVTILESGLTISNVEDEGVTAGDANLGDDFIAANIPPNGPSFPGGIAIFNETEPQVNVALVDKDGTIRMMQAGYKLRIKNKNTTDGRYIFQITTDGGTPIFDIFIQADFDNLQIDMTTKMNNLNTQIGLMESPLRSFAQETPQTELEPDSTPVPDFRFQPEGPLEVTGNPFPDVPEDHPFFQQILDLYKDRVVSGYADGSFKPDQKLTRAEFIKIALGVTNCFDCTEPTDPQKAKYNTNPFPDVSLPAWYFYCISIAKELGMITGYGDGLFRPDRNISRAEAAAVLLRQAGIELTKAPEQAFADVPDYAWYVDYVYTAVEIGLIKENFGFVNPDEEITRGEFAFMAAGVKDIRECRLVDEDGDGVPDWWEMTHNMDPLVPDAERACPCFDNPYPGDTDNDGTRDICDLDIDNDGVLNPMCILDDDGTVNEEKLAAGAATLGEPTDNCIFIPNTDQADYDGNGIGDLCDSAVICPCLDNPNRNDTDKDGIRDVCDDDIDNDSVTNPICIFDDNGLVDPSKITKPADNCLFTQNPDQSDSDNNGKGDACEEIDLCPPVPEDLDGVDDEDGCPELDDEFDPRDPGVYASPGPLCGFIDYATDFMEGDAFMTAITDLETHEVLYSRSSEVPFTPAP